ncbi:hypothetical protein QAO71_17595 (plasmid) [Halopseudomonas sp. SMJS2]|uniref:hypothetical protein n=1 Tax=Halopseudomonas sp. SMJS2 TaxID=3041098 RepID=UPI0024529B53|nr:hypothetical protein [Halopseudomonas sp. SMJS2]WGK63356.1 hypothetical protein QAO71_17595 [Halopseudomonas sp. SMJS2]
MKKLVTSIAFPLIMAIGTHAVAQNEGDIILERNKSLSAMEYKAQKLKLQADMAESLKRMVEAEFLVDEDGNPIGVDSMDKLGGEIRRNQGGAGEMPFPMDMGFGMAPDGFGAPPTIPTDRFVTPPPRSGGNAGRVEAPPKPPKASMTRLAEVHADYVVISTSEGEIVELRVNDKFNDQKLTKIGIDSAHFKGKEGSRVMRINWTQSSASAE